MNLIEKALNILNESALQVQAKKLKVEVGSDDETTPVAPNGIREVILDVMNDKPFAAGFKAVKMKNPASYIWMDGSQLIMDFPSHKGHSYYSATFETKNQNVLSVKVQLATHLKIAKDKLKDISNKNKANKADQISVWGK